MAPENTKDPAELSMNEKFLEKLGILESFTEEAKSDDNKQAFLDSYQDPSTEIKQEILSKTLNASLAEDAPDKTPLQERLVSEFEELDIKSVTQLFTEPVTPDSAPVIEASFDSLRGALTTENDLGFNDLGVDVFGGILGKDLTIKVDAVKTEVQTNSAVTKEIEVKNLEENVKKADNPGTAPIDVAEETAMMDAEILSVTPETPIPETASTPDVTTLVPSTPEDRTTDEEVVPKKDEPPPPPANTETPVVNKVQELLTSKVGEVAATAVIAATAAASTLLNDGLVSSEQEGIEQALKRDSSLRLTSNEVDIISESIVRVKKAVDTGEEVQRQDVVNISRINEGSNRSEGELKLNQAIENINDTVALPVSESIRQTTTPVATAKHIESQLYLSELAAGQEVKDVSAEDFVVDINKAASAKIDAGEVINDVQAASVAKKELTDAGITVTKEAVEERIPQVQRRAAVRDVIAERAQDIFGGKATHEQVDKLTDVVVTAQDKVLNGEELTATESNILRRAGTSEAGRSSARGALSGSAAEQEEAPSELESLRAAPVGVSVGNAQEAMSFLGALRPQTVKLDSTAISDNETGIDVINTTADLLAQGFSADESREAATRQVAAENSDVTLSEIARIEAKKRGRTELDEVESRTLKRFQTELTDTKKDAEEAFEEELNGGRTTGTSMKREGVTSKEEAKDVETRLRKVEEQMFVISGGSV